MSDQPKLSWEWEYTGLGLEGRWRANTVSVYGAQSNAPYTINPPHDDCKLFTVYSNGNEPSEHETFREAVAEAERRHAEYTQHGGEGGER